MWIKLSKKSKALVLGLKPPPNDNTIDKRKSILHIISLFEFINTIDDTLPYKQNDDVRHTDTEDTLLVNTIYIKDSISPANIYKVLFTNNNNDYAPKMTKLTSPNDTTITINGNKYIKCSMHKYIRFYP